MIAGTKRRISVTYSTFKDEVNTLLHRCAELDDEPTANAGLGFNVTVCLVLGEFIGVGVLALPSGIVRAGKIVVVMYVLVSGFILLQYTLDFINVIAIFYSLIV